ncbi:LTA synthase family protein [Acutalibacter sp. 1XD8-33]|nr:LTA synthase family protein [Acutalibacter sp. 1XD8-33]
MNESKNGDQCPMSTSAIKEKFSVRLNLSPGNMVAAAAVLVVSTAFFAFEWPIALEKGGGGRQSLCWWYVLLYSGLGALGAGLCLLRVELSYAAAYRLSWLLMLALPLAAFIAVDMINSTRLWQFPGNRWLANYLCYLLLFTTAYALTRRLWVAVAIGGAASITFGIANYFVVQFRGMPILPWDFQSFSTALTVSGGYEYVPTRKMAVAVMGYLCTVVLCYKLTPHDPPQVSRRFRIAERSAAFGISALLAITIFPLDGLSSLGVSVFAWNQKGSSERTGIAASFFLNMQNMLVDMPTGYSSVRVRNLASRLDTLEPPAPLGEPEKPPTIIAVMNESMTDLGSLNTLKFQPDNQPFLHRLQRSGDCVWGTAYSSVYGGNTCNSEYEFLTGNTMSFLPLGSKPYQQYIKSPHSGLPEILKSYGYHCVAIHPGDRDAWQRIEAYPHLGFHEFVDATIFDVDRTFEHRLTSDQSCYEQLIYEYERWEEMKRSSHPQAPSAGEPLFLFNVTIQNHGGYEDPNYPTRIRVAEAAGKWPKAEQYLSLTKSSDEALEYLLDYFSALDDPVVILFFGDHWPKLEDGFNQRVLENYNINMDLYRVPFLIWANYPLKSQEIEAVSLNYLSGLLLRAAGLEGTAYTNYLETLRQTVPVVTDIGVIDCTGRFYPAGSRLPSPLSGMVNDYAVLQYNNSFDPERKDARLFQREASGAD